MNIREKKEMAFEYFLKNKEFQGTVVDTLDPFSSNRVKVQLDGVTDEINPEDLPWYYILMHVQSQPQGQNNIPAMGSRVVVTFLDDDIMNGRITHSVVSIPPTS
jgi:hypothetical protein